jgi:hypothetical protein
MRSIFCAILIVTKSDLSFEDGVYPAVERIEEERENGVQAIFEEDAFIAMHLAVRPFYSLRLLQIIFKCWECLSVEKPMR